MKDKVFIDTNIIIYSYFSTEDRKQRLVNKIIFLYNESIISTQLINELSNILFKKFKLNSIDIEKVLLELRNVFLYSEF